MVVYIPVSGNVFFTLAHSLSFTLASRFPVKGNGDTVTGLLLPIPMPEHGCWSFGDPGRPISRRC
jgi:hypothetical protein